MKKKIVIMLAAVGVACAPAAKCESGDGAALALSEGVSAKISEILAIKRAAMQLLGMRSENGKLGLDVERALQELSLLLSPEEREAAKVHADSDLRAKIAVWAIDREERKEEYDRFAKYYVNSPTFEEAMDYFWRQEKKRMVAAGIDPDNPPSHIDIMMPRPGTWEPNPVDEEDRKEEFRLILEYCFYMPPTGRKFDRDYYRSTVSEALRSLPDPIRSLDVIASDAQMALSTDSVAPPAGPPIPQDQNWPLRFRNRTGNETAPLYFLCALSNDSAYMAVADLWKIEGAAERIQYEFRWFLQRAGSLENYENTRKLYDAWQALARKHEDDPETQEFAQWLLSLKPPVDLQAPREE